MILYKTFCPNCGGIISSERLSRGLLCEKCFPYNTEDVCSLLKEGEFLRVCQLWENIRRFQEFFKEKVGASPWSIQKTWTTRYFNGRSFSLIAPTGIGKTTFGIILSMFIAGKGGKVYLLFPTELLCLQAYERFKEYNFTDGLLLYRSRASDKEAIKEKISRGSFNILITTTMFLYKNVDIIPKGIFSLIFVDDVDSILKTARNIDKLFLLLGLTERDISFALRYINEKRLKTDNNKDASAETSSMTEEIREMSKKIKGSLIVSSATSRPRSSRILLLREILGFEVGHPRISIRNIEEFYEFPSKGIFEESINKVKYFGSGGLVFLSEVYSKDLENYVQLLRDSGIKADLANARSIEDFKNRKLQVLTGLASYNSPLARGLDLPEVIRYALFIGIPRFEITLRYKENPSALCTLLGNLLPWMIKKDLWDKTVLRRLSQDLSRLRSFKVPSYNDLPEDLRRTALNIKDFIEALFNNDEFLSLIENSDEIAIKLRKEDQEIEPIAIIPDISGYIQASGRTSRLYIGRLTKGLSYILVDDRKALNALKRKLMWYSEDIELREVRGVDLEEILRQIDEDRKRQISNVNLKEKIKTDLVIVESPNKARTISQFFGKPSRRRLRGIDVYEIPLQDRYLTIVASKGHLVDLNKEEGIYGVIPQDGNFIPLFEVIDSSREDIIRAIREVSLEVDEVFIATDPDTEGEKIAYDIYQALRPYQKNIKRTEFHEVTKRAFLEALENSREINLNLVKAQLLRRIADRWIGFEVSLYVQRKLSRSNLSAGRVQTPVLEWIVKRSREARKKLYIVKAEIDGLSVDFDFQNKREAEEFYSVLKEVELEEVSRWQEDLSVKPFNTPALLKEASITLRFSPQKTMELAQDLFEAGLITYHRTDSIRVSQVGVNVATSYIKENFGDKFIYVRTYSEAGGAHECIRPTRPIDAEELFSESLLNFERLSKDHIRLYDLIFRCFIASQMRSARVEKRKIRIKAMSREKEEEFITNIIEDGYNLIIPIRTHHLDLDRKILTVTGKKILQRPVVNYFTYASLIEEMRSKGIGRPSTYAITVQKLFERGYIIEKYGNLLSTPLGIKVYNTIRDNQNFYDLVNEDYTRELEEQMDKVENDGELYMGYLQVLYDRIIRNLYRVSPREIRIKPGYLSTLIE